MKPYMREDEAQAIIDLLVQRRVGSVLEYGSGGSTVIFPRVSSTLKRWVSIEHDPKWAARVCKAIAVEGCANVDLHLVQVHDGDASRYVDLALRLAERFDLVFVDGIHRVSCLLTAPTFLHRDGAVLLHDASRNRYEPGLWPYAKRTRLTEGDGDHQGLLLLEI